MVKNFCDLDQQAQREAAEFLLSKTDLTRNFCETFLRIELCPHEKFYCIRESVTLTAILDLPDIAKILNRKMLAPGKLGNYIDDINKFLSFFKAGELEGVATWHDQAYQSSKLENSCRIWVIDTIDSKLFAHYSRAAFSDRLVSARRALKSQPHSNRQDPSLFRQRFDSTLSPHFFVYQEGAVRKLFLAKELYSLPFFNPLFDFLKSKFHDNAALGFRLAQVFLKAVSDAVKGYAQNEVECGFQAYVEEKLESQVNAELRGLYGLGLDEVCKMVSQAP